MKTYLSLILCICWFSVSSQSILDKNNRWNYSCCYGGPNSHTEIFKIGGDTLINDLIYKKILVTRDSSLNDWRLFHRFLREDALGQIFVDKGSRTSAEKLIYDFNMQLGDTLIIGDQCSYILDTINLISLENGDSRKRMVFTQIEGWNTSMIWIEGLGALEGAFWDYWAPYCATDNNYSLRCYHYNEQLAYRQFEWACFYTNVKQEQLDIVLNLYPNPADETLFINFAEAFIDPLKVLSLN
jgi:hypothetical protein